MNSSPRFIASFSVRLRRFMRSREICTSPPVPETFGRRSTAAFTSRVRLWTFTPARSRRLLLEPSPSASTAARMCTGSMTWLS